MEMAERRAQSRTVIIKDTHRGLWYEDGALVKVLTAGRYELPGRWLRGRREVQLVVVDVRERDLTIKGQEILTADKVAVRVSIIVQFRVTNPEAAMHEVANYEDRLYSDVQLAARQSLAAMNLEEILTSRTRLSEEIRRDVKEVAARYGVAILRADIKDLVFPGNLQEIMNRVLATERLSQAQLVEARTKAEVQRIEADARAEATRLTAAAQADAERLQAENAAEVRRLHVEAEIAALREREKTAAAYHSHPALLRLHELETMRALAASTNARLYINFDRDEKANGAEPPG
jgi:regulator of protease activity HflC (stomatin/prohibitin superfamily)